MERFNRETKDLQWFGYKDTFLALLHSSSHLLESFLHYVNKLLMAEKPYTPIYTPQLRHNLFTPSTQLFHTYLLHTNFLHTYLLHTNLLHNYLLHTNLLPNFSFSQQYLYLTTSIHNFYSQIYLVTLLSHIYNECTQQLDYIHKSTILHNQLLKEYSSLAL